MKPCVRCGDRKPLSEYYRHSQMKDGHLSVCKVCVKARVNNYRQDNLEKVQAYDRERSKLPHRKADKNARRHLYGNASQISYIDRNREKRAAHIAVGNAIRSGKLVPQPCEWCRTGHVHAHHEDYSKPLDVTWLCKDCHGARHRQINEERRQEMTQ